MPLAYRFLVFAVGAILILITALFRYPMVLEEVVQMSHSSTTPSAPIEVALLPGITASSNLGSAVIRVTLKNTSPYAISILRWSSPFDPRAVAIGAFTFTSTLTNTVAPCLNLKFNWKLPESGCFSSDAPEIIGIAPKATIETQVEVKEPEVALTKGERYRVVAQGRWMRVWIHDVEEKDGPEKLSLEDGISGEYKSNEIEIDIQEN